MASAGCKTSAQRMAQQGVIKAEDTKDANLKKNMSFVFESTLAIHGLAGDKKKEDNSFIENSKITPKRFSPLLRQSVAAAGSIIGTLSAGMTSGFSSTLLPQLKQEDSIIAVNQEIESWIASIAALPMFAGCIISGLMIEKYGRKRTHLILTIPFAIGWILISLATSLSQLLVGRFLTGLCVGLLGPAGSVYIGEISDPKYRGFLLAGISLAISIGLLLVHTIGTFLPWQITAGISALVPGVSFLIMAFVPESPSWLATKGRTEEAIKSFKWLRGSAQSSLDEMDALLAKQAAAIVEAQSRPKIPFFSVEKLKSIKETFQRPEFIKPLLIMIAFFFTAQFSGINAIAFYSVSIMKSTLGDGMNEYAAMLIIDGVRLVVSLVACIILRVLGRRPLAMFSGCFTVLCLYGLAGFRYATSEEDIGSYSWVPLLFLIGYIIATTIGLAGLPWVMTGEVFPVDLRGIGSGICTCMCFCAFFLVVKTAPAMFTELGSEGTFLAYGTVALLGTATLYFFLPETKGRTLQDIEESFRAEAKQVNNDVENQTKL